MAEYPAQRRLSGPVVLVINGKGGVGKDTLCEFARSAYRARMVSAITPVKEIAKSCGWRGEKDGKARRFLSDLKRLLIEYNDLPNRYLLREYDSFLREDLDILFVQIREYDQIQQFREQVHTPCFTLLVTSNRAGMNNGPLGNSSDDRAESFPYDLVYRNDFSLDETKERFCEFLRSALRERGIAASREDGAGRYNGPQDSDHCFQI